MLTASLPFRGRLLLALAALIGGMVALPATARPAAAQELPFSIVIDKAEVNQYGGIRVEGTADCTAAVEAYYPNPADRPDQVLIGPWWTATQYVGKTKAISVAYESGIARPCYIKREAGPYRWYTVTAYPDSHPTWLYSPDGKFSPGRVHIEVATNGGWEIRAGQPSEAPYLLVNFSQFDLRAVKVVVR